MPLQDFLWSHVPRTIFFLVGTEAGEGGYILYCCNVNLHPAQSDSLEQASKKYFFGIFHSKSFCFKYQKD